MGLASYQVRFGHYGRPAFIVGVKALQRGTYNFGQFRLKKILVNPTVFP